ncbi:response regulator [Litorivicinus lipolyticus]|uniref:Response regulator n=1 Tax=Litorivicinus lipolyticus TaxID=418701 RepID=A0A5Q2QEN2_9GAMM|nr:sigma-54 dependent transcriptional regulator [Litorivicinus lipolyticus]QGG79475.1 response regulator [Litorivicinus lipolyticus]
MKSPHIVLIDDDLDLSRALAQSLELEGFEVRTFSRGAQALERLSRDDYAVVLTDYLMPGLDGLDVLERVQAIDSVLPVVVMTGHGDVPMAVKCMRLGAHDFIEKPCAVEQLVRTLNNAVERRRLVLENRVLRSELTDNRGLQSRLVGQHPSMDELRHRIQVAAEAQIDCLIVGETGTGKEVVARALHDEGPRASGPFIAINCSAIPTDMIESELFGHVAGAFTGAQGAREGRLAHAAGGTVFLDELESMNLDVQSKLLRAIENRTIEPLGSNQSIQLDVCFVAAIKSTPEADPGLNLRSDLYYRLNVVQLPLLPLRERISDVPALFYHLAREARGKYRREIPELSPALEQQLMAYGWPGNVRELRNLAERFVLGLWHGFATPTADGQQPLADQVAAFEASVIRAALIGNAGQMKATYEALGLSRKGLYDKLQRHGIDGSKLTHE